ncbi:MAG: hypothetical protein MKZ70_04855 [Opitutales bacterium]|nr:hypothetical protein [Opitutales bacterium]
MTSPKGKSDNLKNKIQRFDTKHSTASLTVTQPPIWRNWNPIVNLGPSNLHDAPILLALGPNNYWIFGRYGGGQSRPED